MLGDLPQINRAVQGVGFVVGTQRPFVAFLMKNWPLALVGGFAMFARGRERLKKGEFNTYNLMADAGLILSPLVGLALLNQLAREEQQLDALSPNPAGPVPAIPTMTAAPHPSQQGM
jgi:hypothetical protein